MQSFRDDVRDMEAKGCRACQRYVNGQYDVGIMA